MLESHPSEPPPTDNPPIEISMNFISASLTRTAFVSALIAATLCAGGIEWQKSYGETVTLAAAESRVIFVAVNMLGERANERMLASVYTEE